MPQISDLRNGSYEISWKGKVAGEYSLLVTINDAPVRGSPTAPPCMQVLTTARPACSTGARLSNGRNGPLGGARRGAVRGALEGQDWCRRAAQRGLWGNDAPRDHLSRYVWQLGRAVDAVVAQVWIRSRRDSIERRQALCMRSDCTSDCH